ncbi:MAG: hypothetical protein ACK5OC_18930 [Pirellula sp.]
MANLHFDSEGRFIGSVQPGDADWVNPQTMSGFAYRGMASGWLDYLNRFSAQIPREQLQRDLRFWSAFRDKLALVGEQNRVPLLNCGGAKVSSALCYSCISPHDLTHSSNRGIPCERSSLQGTGFELP